MFKADTSTSISDAGCSAYLLPSPNGTRDTAFDAARDERTQCDPEPSLREALRVTDNFLLAALRKRRRRMNASPGWNRKPKRQKRVWTGSIKLVEDGVAKIDDVLTARITGLKLEHEQAGAALARAKTSNRSTIHISPEILERFGTTMRDSLTTGAVQLRKTVITSFVDRIEVDDHEIRIVGDKGNLKRAVFSHSGSNESGKAGVRSLVRNWRATTDEGDHYEYAVALR